jgi:hypothetical protein
MYDLHISICFTIDARFPAFVVGGLSNRQNVGQFNHESKHKQQAFKHVDNLGKLLTCFCLQGSVQNHPPLIILSQYNKQKHQTKTFCCQILVKLVIPLLTSVAGYSCNMTDDATCETELPIGLKLLFAFWGHYAIPEM